MFCLIPAQADKFLDAIKSGKINPEKLSNMSSQQRRAFLAKHVGEENAKSVNALFESKLLLKNQQQGMVTWAKKVSGISEPARRDLISRINRLDRVLDPGEKQQFLEDLASTRLGIDVSQAEAKTIAQLARRVEETKAAMANGGDRLEYGRAKVELGEYVSDLKLAAEKMPLKDYAAHPIKGVSNVAGIAKSVKASLDNSAIFRQGWKTLFTDPGTWQRNARQSFVDLVRQFGNKPVMKEITSDIVSRPNYDKYQKMKLATSTIEEAYPSHLPGKVPGLGRLYKASESAYTGFVYRMRADLADKYLEIAERSGVNINDPKELLAIGKMINSLTGRGNLGAGERIGNTVNNVFFSPRFLKSNIDTLTAHQFQKGVTPFVRKQAAVNLLKVVSGTATILAIANAVKPGSVDFDPRSSNFGKIKVGNTRFDVTGGMSSIATLASRVASQSSKSSSTGQITKLNTGKFGSQSSTDVIYNFFENKFSPAASVLKDIITQQDFYGNKPTAKNELINMFAPLPITTTVEAAKDPNSAGPLLVALADGLGISANTYGRSHKNWENNISTEQQAFKSRVGDADFKKANDEYNRRLDRWLQVTTGNPVFKGLPEDQKQVVLTSGKKKIQDNIFKDYGFKYNRKKPDSTIKASKSSLLQNAR